MGIIHSQLSVSFFLCLFFIFQEIHINEKHRHELQEMVDEAINNNGNKTYLRILSQYRLLVSESYDLIGIKNFLLFPLIEDMVPKRLLVWKKMFLRE